MALEVQGRSASDSAGASQPDSQDGRREPAMGRRANSQRAIGQTRAPVVTENSRQVHAETTTWAAAWRSALVHFLEEPWKSILACDFFVAVTATFRMLYVFVVIEHGTRRLAHVNVTAHPSADWTLQQLREVIGDIDGRNKYLIHDRDRIFAKHLDDSIRALGVEVLRSPIASPKANSICERVIGTIRRECLDWMIPLSEAHLRSILKSWVGHYIRGAARQALPV